MAIITIEMRAGRSNDQKRALASALLDVVSRAMNEPRENIHLIIREHPGFNLVENAQHLPDIANTQPP
jgi:trans-3-chloroacrylic acid dehalogenase alpha subunit